MVDETFSIRNMTKGKTPHLPFRDIKEAILGKKYSLSLVLIGSQRGRSLNEKFRNKTTIPNVLSFPLETTEGEIFITPARARTQAKKFGKTERQMIGYLFIHGLLHLKGMDHGSTMDKAEQRFCTQFQL